MSWKEVTKRKRELIILSSCVESRLGTDCGVIGYIQLVRKICHSGTLVVSIHKGEVYHRALLCRGEILTDYVQLAA